MAGSRRAQFAIRRRVLWRQPLAVVQEYRLPVQSGAENAAAGSLFTEYPNPRLLAKDIKQRLHDGEIVSFGLDPYCMMLERVTEYLTAIEDPTRTDLVRRCFYLKVCEKLSRERACVGWRREVLSQLVKEWGWDDARLTMLDNRANWKIDQYAKRITNCSMR